MVATNHKIQPSPKRKVTMSTPNSATSTNRRIALARINSSRPPNDQHHNAGSTTITAELVGQLAGVSHHNQLGSIVRLDLDLRQHHLSPITDCTNLGKLVPNVKLLNLAFNGISKMDGFDAVRHLVELNLAENRIQTIENLSSLRGLQRLNLSGNQICRLPASISELQQLSVLRLSRNLLEVVGDLRHLVSLQVLNHLRIDDNPFSQLEKTVPFALFCVPSLDSINGCEIMPHERKEAALRFHQLATTGLVANNSSKVRFDDEDGDKENAPRPRQSLSTPDNAATPLPEKRLDWQTAPVRLAEQRLQPTHISQQSNNSQDQSQDQDQNQYQGQNQSQSRSQSRSQSQSQSQSQNHRHSPGDSQSILDESTFSRDSAGNSRRSNQSAPSALLPQTPSASSPQFRSPNVTSPEIIDLRDRMEQLTTLLVGTEQTNSTLTDSLQQAQLQAQQTTAQLAVALHSREQLEALVAVLQAKLDDRGRVEALERQVVTERHAAEHRERLAAMQREVDASRTQQLQMQAEIDALRIDAQGAADQVAAVSEQLEAARDECRALLHQRDEAMGEGRRWRDRCAAQDSELDAIRAEVLSGVGGTGSPVTFSSSPASAPTSASTSTSAPASAPLALPPQPVQPTRHDEEVRGGTDVVARLQADLEAKTEALAAKTEALAAAELHVNEMKKAFALVSFAIPPPPPPDCPDTPLEGGIWHPQTPDSTGTGRSRGSVESPIQWGQGMGRGQGQRQGQSRRLEQGQGQSQGADLKTAQGSGYGQAQGQGRGVASLSTDDDLHRRTVTATLQVARITLVRDVTALTEENTRLTESVASLHTELATLSAQHTAAVTQRVAATEAVVALQSTLGRLQDEKTSLEDTQASLDERATATAADVARLEARHAALTQVLAALPAPLTDEAMALVRQERIDLDERVEALRVECRTLDERVSELRCCMAALEGQYATVDAQRSEADKAVRAQQEVMIRLQGRIATLEEESATAMARAEQARVDREASVGLQEDEYKALALARADVLRAKGELVEAEGRIRRTNDAASAEDHKLRLLKSLASDQSRLLQAELDALNAEVSSKHDRLVALEEERRTAEEEIESRRRELVVQCRQLRKDEQTERARVVQAQSDVRSMQGEIEQLTGRHRAAMDELTRVEENIRSAQRRAEMEVKDKSEQIRHAERRVREMEDALSQGRSDQADIEQQVTAVKGQLEDVQRELKEAHAVGAERQKAANEELKQTQQRLQLSSAALRELATQSEKRRMDLEACRTVLRQAECRREEALTAAQQAEAAAESLRDTVAVLERDMDRSQADLVRGREESEMLTARQAMLKQEIALNTKVRDDLQGEVLRLGERTKELAGSEATLQSAVGALTSQVESARQELQHHRSMLERERRAVAEAHALRAVADGELQQRQEDAQRAMGESATHEARLVAAEDAAATAHRELGAVQRRLRDVQADSRLREEELKRREGTARAGLDRVRSELESTSAAVVEEQRKLAHLVDEQDSLGRAVEATKDAHRRLHIQLDEDRHISGEVRAQASQWGVTREALKGECGRLEATATAERQRLAAIAQQLADEVAALGRAERDRAAVNGALVEEEKQLAHQRLLLRCAAEELAALDGKIRAQRSVSVPAPVPLPTVGTMVAPVSAHAYAYAYAPAPAPMSVPTPVSVPVAVVEPPNTAAIHATGATTLPLRKSSESPIRGAPRSSHGSHPNDTTPTSILTSIVSDTKPHADDSFSHRHHPISDRNQEATHVPPVATVLVPAHTPATPSHTALAPRPTQISARDPLFPMPPAVGGRAHVPHSIPAPASVHVPFYPAVHAALKNTVVATAAAASSTTPVSTAATKTKASFTASTTASTAAVATTNGAACVSKSVDWADISHARGGHGHGHGHTHGLRASLVADGTVTGDVSLRAQVAQLRERSQTVLRNLKGGR